MRRAIAVDPPSRWNSRVVYFKVVTPGHPVSYGSVWQIDHLVRVVTIPVGYRTATSAPLSNVTRV